LNAVVSFFGEIMNTEQLTELDTSLTDAAKALRHAWRLMKHNGMDATAKEIADTVLDVETSARLVSKQLAEALEN
jgi:putative hemolysin